MNASSILSVKAGLVQWDEDTKVATPRRGQGQVSVLKNPEDPSLYSFKWDPRGEFRQKCPESDILDLLLFPGDAIWEHVPECTTGRVFALTYKSSGQRLLFWMQTPNETGGVADLTDEDKRIAQEISKILDDDSMMEEADEELPDAAPIETPARDQVTTGLGTVLENLRRQQSRAGEQQYPVTASSDVISVSKLVQHVEGLSEEELEPLYARIPDAIPKTRQELIRVIRSSQFAQSVSMLDSILLDGGSSIVSQQLGIPYEGEGVEGFLRALRSQAKSENEDSEEKMEE